MKFLTITTLLLAFGLNAQATSPGSVNKTTSTSAVLDTTSPNSESNAAKTDEMNTGISPRDMNTAPTETPLEAQESDTFGTTLSTGDQGRRPYRDGTFAPNRDESEKQAQEDRTLDYSTSPNSKPLEDNEEEEQE